MKHTCFAVATALFVLACSTESPASPDRDGAPSDGGASSDDGAAPDGATPTDGSVLADAPPTDAEPRDGGLDDGGLDDGGSAITDGGTLTAADCPLAPGAAGDVWVDLSHPSMDHSLSDLTFAPDGTAFATVFTEGVYRASPPCYDTWENVYPVAAGWFRIVSSTTGTIVASTGQASMDGSVPPSIAISHDGGDTWIDLLPTLLALDTRAPITFPSLAAAPDAPTIYVGSGWANGEPILYRSLDDGMTWSRLTSSSMHSAVGTVAVGIVAEPSGRLFVGTEGQGAWGSRDSGDTFPDWYFRPGPLRQARHVRTHPTSVLIASLDNGMDMEGGLYRTDASGTFTLLPPPPELVTPRSDRWVSKVLEFHFSPSGAIMILTQQTFVGGISTIAISHDVGDTWTTQEAGIPAMRVVQGLEPGVDGYLYAHGTMGALYRTRMPFD